MNEQFENKQEKNFSKEKEMESKRKPGSKGFQAKSKSLRKSGKGKPYSRNSDLSCDRGNDPSWYELTPEIAKKTANFYYGYIPGNAYPLTMSYIGDNGTPEKSVSANAYIPTVMAIDYFPSFGTSTSKVSGLNMAATQLYTWYRQANSGARNYEAPDLMMYCLAMVDALSTWFYIRRCLQVTKFMPKDNRNYPRALAHAMNFDYDDAVKNFAQYCARLNLLAVKFNSWAIPAEFDAIKRYIYVNSQVFTDSDSIRGQSYVFVKKGYYKFDGKTSTHGSKLALKKFGLDTGNWSLDSKATIDQMLDQLDDCLTALYYDEDITIMSGDTLKAFKDNLVTLPEFVSENEPLSLVYDPDVLAQIENMSFASVNIKGTNWDDTIGLNFDYIQGDGEIQCSPIIYITDTSSVGSNPGVMKDRILNSRKDDPAYSDNLEWTRLMPTYDIETTSVGSEVKKYFRVTSCGLELPIALRVITCLRSGGTIQPMTTATITSTFELLKVSDSAVLNDIVTFDWHPIFYAYGTSAGLNGIKVYGDIKFPTIVAESVLKSLNDAAQQAVFSRKVKGANRLY